MAMQFYVFHSYHVWRGRLQTVSKLEMAENTSYGPVRLRLKIAWGIDKAVLRPSDEIDARRLFNRCFSYNVVMPKVPKIGLSLRTLEYFDGDGRIVYVDKGRDETVLRCDMKWLYSASRCADHCGGPAQLQPLEQHMHTRLVNAYADL